MNGAKSDLKKKSDAVAASAHSFTAGERRWAAISHLIWLQTQHDSCAQLHGSAADNGMVQQHKPALVAWISWIACTASEGEAISKRQHAL